MSTRDAQAELRNILDALGESALEASDDEIRDDLITEKLDPAKVAADVGSGLLQVTQKFRRRRLQTARAAYDSERRRLATERHTLPESAREQRKLLAAIMARTPALGRDVLTAQYRNLDEMTDEDVRSALRQLYQLGEPDDDAGK